MIGDSGGAGVGSRTTLLLVDDDERRTVELQSALETAGYRVLAAADGAAGLRLVSAHDVEAVLCRLHLPDIAGLDVCRAIKQASATRELPIVMLVDSDDEVMRDKILEAGADESWSAASGTPTLLLMLQDLIRIKRMRSQINQLEGVVLTLSRAVEDRDRLSAGLSEKVAHWALQLGNSVGLADEQLTLLYKAALLRDVGTVGIPITILIKEGRLDSSEFEAVKRHPEMSEEIVRPLPGSEQLLPAVRHHHERIDGAGYPDGLGGEAIPLFGRIIAIADAYVAMTSDRPYRRSRTKAEAIKILQQGAGKQWDADLVERFLRLVARADTEELSVGRAG